MFPANIGVVLARGTVMLPCKCPRGVNAPGRVQGEARMSITHGGLKNNGLFHLTESF